MEVRNRYISDRQMYHRIRNKPKLKPKTQPRIPLLQDWLFPAFSHALLASQKQAYEDFPQEACVHCLSSFRLYMVIRVHQGTGSEAQGEMLASVLRLQGGHTLPGQLHPHSSPPLPLQGGPQLPTSADPGRLKSPLGFLHLLWLLI